MKYSRQKPKWSSIKFWSSRSSCSSVLSVYFGKNLFSPPRSRVMRHSRMPISFGTGLPTEFQWLFPIILAVFFYFVWHAGNDQPPDFRMSPQGPYTIRRETKLTQSPYFVDASFESYYSSGPKIRKLEKDVDTKYVNHLMSSCRQEKEMRTSLRSKDREEQVPSCVELEKRGYKLGA